MLTRNTRSHSFSLPEHSFMTLLLDDYCWADLGQPCTMIQPQVIPGRQLPPVASRTIDGEDIRTTYRTEHSSPSGSSHMTSTMTQLGQSSSRPTQLPKTHLSVSSSMKEENRDGNDQLTSPQNVQNHKIEDPKWMRKLKMNINKLINKAQNAPSDDTIVIKKAFKAACYTQRSSKYRGVFRKSTKFQV